MSDTTPPIRDLVVFENREALSRDALCRFTALAVQAYRAGREFRVALAGGSTPALLYRLLASDPLSDIVPWRNVQLFFGDERCVSPDSEDSNYRMTQESLLAHLQDLPPGAVHRMEGEIPIPDEAARRYEAAMRAGFEQALDEDGWPRFDLVLLGMGPDGHCASLFPHKPALNEQTRWVVATEPGLKPFVPRLTLTLPVLNRAANVLFLVAGEDKAETAARVLQGPADHDTLPSQAVVPTNGTLTWLLDRAAAARLK